MDPLLQRLVSLVETRWPLQCASIQPIKVRENAVYAVHLRDGSKVVLRVHRCGYHCDAALQSERTWMQALEEHGIEVPRHVLSHGGRSFEKSFIEGFDGERQVDVPLDTGKTVGVGRARSGVAGRQCCRYLSPGGAACGAPSQPVIGVEHTCWFPAACVGCRRPCR